MSKRYAIFDGRSIKFFDGQTIVFADDRQHSNRQLLTAPWLYRALDLRCMAVASMPYRVVNGAGEEVDNPLQVDWWRLLYQTEAALIVYGAAYWLVERNRLRPYGLRWMLPSTITPILDPSSGISGFNRTAAAGRSVKLTLEDVVYIYRPAADDELLPGIAPLQAAASAAGIAVNSNRFLEDFFRRGAIGTTILQVDGNPPETEIRKLEGWWRQVAAGISNAWQSVALRSNVNPVKVGADIKDLNMSPVYDTIRQQICAAIGVPQTLLEDAANYATAAEHRRSFYDETVVPECRMIESAVNAQLFSRLGLTFEFMPLDLEIYQRDETEKASALVALVQNGIITANEARDWLGFEVIEEEQAQDNRNDAAVEIAAETEMRRYKAWMAKGEQKRAFTSRILRPELLKFIKALADDNQDAFRAVRKVEDMMDEDARKLEERINLVLQPYRNKVAKIIAEGGIANDVIAQLEDELTALLLPSIRQIIYDGVIRDLMTSGIAFDPAVINQRALDWARNYTYDLIRGLTDTTRRVVEDAVSAFVGTPGMTVGDLADMLTPAFGEYRGRMIAVTETTRAYAEAARERQDLLAELGVEMVRVWNTSEDERVCPICGPMDGLTEDNWNGLEPPAHVNCRCWVTLRARKR